MSLPAPSQSLAYDVDGNLTDDGVWLYTWDGENRLKSMEHKDYGGSASKLYYKLTFDYDSQSRRIRKQVQTKTTFGGAWGGATSHLFVCDDWNLLLWVNGSVAKQGYHWLPDMSGTWQGAGGVRGLVGISYKDQGGAAYYWSLNVGYDGNGNVVGLYGDVGGSTGLYAVYEYDPFGNTIRQNVTPAGNSLATTLGENPFRFSTKFTDDESKLIYYGYRYYSAGLGRWVNRDPIAEGGGLNLSVMVMNNAVNSYDRLGLIMSDVNRPENPVSTSGLNFNINKYKARLDEINRPAAYIEFGWDMPNGCPCKAPKRVKVAQFVRNIGPDGKVVPAKTGGTKQQGTKFKETDGWRVDSNSKSKTTPYMDDQKANGKPMATSKPDGSGSAWDPPSEIPKKHQGKEFLTCILCVDGPLSAAGNNLRSGSTTILGCLRWGFKPVLDENERTINADGLTPNATLPTGEELPNAMSNWNNSGQNTTQQDKRFPGIE
jgi:RHS repeat-associated protein